MALPDADGQTCPNCGEPADSNAVRCPACETPLLGGFDTDAVAAQLDAIDGEATRAPRWAVALTGLALGIAISPLVVFTVVLAGVEPRSLRSPGSASPAGCCPPRTSRGSPTRVPRWPGDSISSSPASARCS
ncbi:hypothetical protein ACFQH8_10730 [Halomicroarcula sp. GCM10025710]